MARPTKTTRRRGVVREATPLKVALSAAERATLDHKASAAKMTLADFARSLIASSTVEAREDPRRAAFLLANLTSNLNQLARIANSFGPAAQMEVVAGLRSLAASAEAIVAEHCPAIADRRGWSKANPK